MHNVLLPRGEVRIVIMRPAQYTVTVYRIGTVFNRILDLFLFFRQCPSGSVCMPIFEFLASTIPEIRRGSQNSKIGSCDPLVTPIDLIFHFFPCLLYTSPSPRDGLLSRMPSSA